MLLQCHVVLNNFPGTWCGYNFLRVAGIDYRQPGIVPQTECLETHSPLYHLPDHIMHPVLLYILFLSMCRSLADNLPMAGLKDLPMLAAFEDNLLLFSERSLLRYLKQSFH